MTIASKLYGLVLSGGKSTRMGADKGLIPYHGIPQREYLYNLLSKVCDQTFVSLRQEQESGLSKGMRTIIDEDIFRGPYNGLLSAHGQHEDVAWLVLACDLPLMDMSALQQLIRERDTGSLATAFALKENPLPEPLCAIWEPLALEMSKTYLQCGNGSCPRKFLINNPVKLVFPEKAEVLLNANSVEDYEAVLAKLATH